MIFRRKPAKDQEAAEAAASQDGDAVSKAIQQFEAQLNRHEDLLYGVALFFEGLNVLYEGHDETIATYRKQFRNIIQHGKEVAQQAMKLLEEARDDPGAIDALTNFRFTMGEGHEQPEELARRAEVLVETYKRIFPDRSRDVPFTHEETIQLIEEAAEAF